jgi:hypothetical protein
LIGESLIIASRLEASFPAGFAGRALHSDFMTGSLFQEEDLNEA